MGIIQRLMVAGGAVLATLLALELGLRVVGYAGAETRQPFRASQEFGEISGHVLRRLMPFDDDGTRVHLRGQDVPYAKRAGVTRVLFVGDSDTAGSGVALEQAFPAVFGRLVEEAAPGSAEVFNFGVPGMSPNGAYAFFTRHLAKLDPDVVVLGLFMANDLSFCLDDGQRHDPRDATFRESFTHVRDRFALLHFLHLRLLASSGGRLSYEQARDDPALLPYALSHRGIHARRYDVGELLTYLVEDVPLTDAMWAAVEAVFRDFQRLADERRFQFTVVLLPTGSAIFGRLHVQGMPDVLEGVNRAHRETFTPADFDVHKASRRVLAICRRTGTVCLDPTARMRGTPPERFYGLGNHHSAEMFALIGDELFRHWDPAARGFARPLDLGAPPRRREAYPLDIPDDSLRLRRHAATGSDVPGRPAGGGSTACDGSGHWHGDRWRCCARRRPAAHAARRPLTPPRSSDCSAIPSPSPSAIARVW